MLRKLSSVVVGTLLISGIAVAAQGTSTMPSQVDESHPGHTSGQSMPSMEGKRAAKATADAKKARPAPSATSVDESHPGHTGGQSMPSMGKGR